MKKSILHAAVAVFSMAALASCNDEPSTKPIEPVEPTEGNCYVLSQGSQGVNIDGALTVIDADTHKSTNYAFKAVNGRSLGNTPQCAVTYGSRIYIGVCESNVIEIVDRATLKSVKQISLSKEVGQSPRSMAVKDGKVYVSMFNGYVSRLDTVSLSIDGCVKVGPNPENIAIRGNYLYVPNSDGMNWQLGYGNTASKINLSTFKVEKTFEVDVNPVQFLSDDYGLYLVCRGNYADVLSNIYKVTADDELMWIANCTYAAISGGNVYMIYAPFGAEPTYSFFDSNYFTDSYGLDESAIKPMPASVKVDSPTAIAVDPYNGNIAIGSNSMDGGFASYTTPGYCKLFTADGKEIGKYDTGVCPNFIFY